MKKKLVAISTAVLLAASLAACGSTATGADTAASVAATASAATSESSSVAVTGNTAPVSSGTTYKVGIVQYVDDASLNQIQQNVQSELDKLGTQYGVTFDYADYTYNGQADGTVLQQIASELVADEVDVIVPIATPTAQIMQAATEGKDIPIVFSAVSDPVGAKLVASMDAPGANITGTSDALNTNAIMDLIFAAQPDADYIGILYSSSEDASTQPVADAEAYLDAKGIKYIEKTGTNNDEVSTAADALIAEGVDAIFTPTDNTIMTAELAIYEKLAKAGIAHYCGADSFALNGAFIGYGVDYSNLGVETADMVADILVNGADPATTAVKTFDNGIVTINTDTATALGLDLATVESAIKPLATQITKTATMQEFGD